MGLNIGVLILCC